MIGARLAHMHHWALSRSDGRTLAVLGSSPFGVAVVVALLLIARTGHVFDPAVVPVLWASGALMSGFAIYAGLRRHISDPEWAVYTALTMTLISGIGVTVNEPILAEQLTSTLILPPLMAAAFLSPRSVVVYGAVAVALSWAVPVWAHEASRERFIGSLLISVTITVATGFVALMRSALDQARQQAELMAISDQLTGLLNRRGMTQQVPALMALAQRNHGIFTTMVADVDHFKRINDTLGHHAGDEVLEQLATLIRASLRPGDLAVRLGGEEFAVLAVLQHPTDAHLIAQRLRESIANSTTTAPTPAVTISIGVTYAPITTTSISDSHLEHFLNTADALLYEAKSAGRNCVRIRELHESPLRSLPTPEMPAPG